MTKTAALEYGKAKHPGELEIHPGGIDTPMTRGVEPRHRAGDDLYEVMAMGRVGNRRIAPGAVPSPATSRATGTGSEFTADGGQLAGTVKPICRQLSD